MLWGCAKVDNASELIGIRNRIHTVLTKIDEEIAAKEAALAAATDAQERRGIEYDLQVLRRSKTELQQALVDGENWENLSDDARGRLGERMIQNLSALPKINQTSFGPLTGSLINDISHVARLMSRGQAGVQMDRMCRRASDQERRELGCP